MKVKGINWLGIRTDRFEDMNRFFEGLLGLQTGYQEEGFKQYVLPNGDKVEVFGPQTQYNRHFTNPVVGFLVDDIHAARAEMEAAGIEFVGPIQQPEAGGYAWSHFRAPDGNLYELAYDPKHPDRKGRR